MTRKIIITEAQEQHLFEEAGLTKADVTHTISNTIKGDREFEVRVKNIAADVIKNLFKTLWQRNGIYDSEIRR